MVFLAVGLLFRGSGFESVSISTLCHHKETKKVNR